MRSPTRQELADKQVECQTHGNYIASGALYFGKREIWSGCPGCDEDRLKNERQAQVQERAAAARERIESMVAESAIPPRFVGRTFDNFHAETDEQNAALYAVKDYADHFNARRRRGHGLILSGLPGTGKSHLAAAVLQSIMPEHQGLYITCMGLIRAVRGTWRKDSERSEAQVLRLFGGVPLLVLDEIGVQYGTDGEQTILFDVLDKRYRDMQPTILLTNQNKDGFKQFVGERSFDRLVESCKWVSFDWPSYRPTARTENV
jgi:DNA replication protein DnaC